MATSAPRTQEDGAVAPDNSEPFRSLRLRNVRRARLALLAEVQRQRRLRIERVVAIQRERRSRQGG